MKVYPLKISLLSPFFNYSQVTKEGVVTSDFIGDLALTYALNKVRGDQQFYRAKKDKPNYVELKSLGYFFTVAKPLHSTKTGVYIRRADFVKDGIDKNIIEVLSRKNLFKNFFKVQGIQPGAVYTTYLLSQDQLDFRLPFTIRIGAGRECLAKVELDTSPDREDIWLNVYSLKMLLGEEKAKALFEDDTAFYRIRYVLENYVLLQNVPYSKLESIFETVFQPI